MKARVIESDEIVDVFQTLNFQKIGGINTYIDTTTGRIFRYEELDFNHITIDWEQRRYEITKAAIQGILSNQDQVDFACSQANYSDGKHLSSMAIAQYAVACADALIDELKRNNYE